MLIEFVGSLGDVVCTTPAIREYAKKFPNEYIQIESKIPDIYINNPHVGSGDNDNKGFFVIPPPSPYSFPGTIAGYYGQQLGVKVINPTPEIFLTEEEKSLYPKRDDVVIINTWAGWTNRRWALENFKTLIDLLHQKGMKVVEVGKTTTDCFYTTSHPALQNVDESLIDKQTIRETVALLAKSKLYIGNASGVVDLAASVGTKQVVLYSGAVAWWSRGYETTYPVFPMTMMCKKCCTEMILDFAKGKNHQHAVMQNNVTCQNNNFCMDEILPQDVIEMCESYKLL